MDFARIDYEQTERRLDAYRTDPLIHSAVDRVLGVDEFFTRLWNEAIERHTEYRAEHGKIQGE